MCNERWKNLRNDKVSNVFRQMWRGCGYLPRVGEHPGTLYVGVLLFASIAAGGLVGLAIMGAVVLPIYLIGAYDRAEYEDRLDDCNGDE